MVTLEVLQRTEGVTKVVRTVAVVSREDEFSHENLWNFERSIYYVSYDSENSRTFVVNVVFIFFWRSI